MKRAAPPAWHLLLGPAVDAAAFMGLVRAGWHYGLAHITSFAIAGILSALATGLIFPRHPDVRREIGRGVALLAVNLLALFLRGGVLALLVARCSVPPPVAILGAIITSTLVIQRGRRLCAPASAWPADGARARAIVIALGACAVLLRLAYLGCVDLFPEEAYYWNYGRHLDIGYLDHPPIVAWLIRGGTIVFGDSEFGVRIGAVLCSAIASIFAYRSAREMYGRPSALVALALMQLLPAYFLCGMFMTPDAPLAAAWATCLYFLQRALLSGEARAWWGAGIALGIGLLSKYTIGLLVPAVLVFMLIDPLSRRWLARMPPYVAGVLALLIFSPVILWNARHDWASFTFQTSQRLAEAPRFSLHKLIASAFALLGPTAFIALPFVLRGGGERSPAHGEMAAPRRARFARVFTLVPLSVFGFFSLRHTVKFDWTGVLWIALVPALAHAITAPAAERMPGWLRGVWVPTALGSLVAYGALLHYLTLGPPQLPYSHDLRVLPVAWRDLGGQVDALAREVQETSGASPLVVGMNRYTLASELAFYADDPRRAALTTTSQHLFGPSGLMYEQWFPNKAQVGRTLLLVALDAPELDDGRLSAHVAALGPVQEGPIRHNGRIIGQYFYRVARDYRDTP